MRRAAVLALVAVLGSGVSACGSSSSTDDYCAAVTSHRDDLSRILGDGGGAALLDALPIFRELQAKAPSDIADDWTTVIDRLAALDAALKAAGVDPSTYDAAHAPASLAAAQREAIATAATALGSPATVSALDAVQQQARDVCHTPITL
ncbi:MAG: hypothetical protein ACXVDH_09070 [Nocardioides sp.]